MFSSSKPFPRSRDHKIWAGMGGVILIFAGGERSNSDFDLAQKKSQSMLIEVACSNKNKKTSRLEQENANPPSFSFGLFYHAGFRRKQNRGGVLEIC